MSPPPPWPLPPLPPPPPRATPRLYAYFDADPEHAHSAALLLRSAAHRTAWQLLTWDLRDDRVTPGQWLTRAAVAPDRACLLGGLFLYAYREARARGATWAVVSRPPHFTALAIAETSRTSDAWLLRGRTRPAVLVSHRAARCSSTQVRALPPAAAAAEYGHLDPQPPGCAVRGPDGEGVEPLRGRRVRVRDGRLFAGHDALQIADLSAAAFAPVAPPADYLRAPA